MNLNLIAKVLIICLGLLEAVSSIPKLYPASDGKEYLVELVPKFNWIQAWNECASKDYQLVEIDSEDKNSAIMSLLNDRFSGEYYMWIGGNDEFNPSQDTTRKIVWSATGNQFVFSNWGIGQPDNNGGNEHCVNIENSFVSLAWSDSDCKQQMGFICEVSHYKKECDDNRSRLCAEFEKVTSSIISAVNQAKTTRNIDIENTINGVGNWVATFTANVKNEEITMETSIKNILDEEQNKVKSLLDEMQKQINELKSEIVTSVNNISGQFDNKLSGKQNEINEIC